MDPNGPRNSAKIQTKPYGQPSAMRYAGMAVKTESAANLAVDLLWLGQEVVAVWGMGVGTVMRLNSGAELAVAANGSARRAVSPKSGICKETGDMSFSASPVWLCSIATNRPASEPWLFGFDISLRLDRMPK